MVNVEIKKVVDRIYSEDNDGIGEWEPLEIEGLGWLIYQVEDNNGSISIFITEEKVEQPPEDEEQYTSFKVLYKGGTLGGDGEGDGYLFSNLRDNLYRTRDTFDSNEEAKELLIEKLEQLI